ncbi:ABC [Ectocarpus sp. CCAP 1310/34]|nr:ABC [Ectocarpus sp. CCAP 1310/34]
MLDGVLSKFFDIEQGVPQGYTLSPTLFQVFINDLLEVVEAVRKGVKVGDTETSVSGMLFADDFVGMSDTPEGLQLQIDAAKKFTDKWRLSANVQKSAVMVCNENKEEPVEHRWKWGIEEIAVVDQYTYLGVEIAKDCSWNAHMSKVAEKGKARAGKLHPILANRHLDTRINLTVLKSVIVPPLEYTREAWEGNKKVVKELEAAQMKAAKIILGCSTRTSNAAVRAELGIQSLRSGRDARKLTWQYRMCGMGEERLPRIVWEAKWANKKRGRQPTEWVKVVEDVWKGLDIDEDETLETEGLQGFKEKISVACAERGEKKSEERTKLKANYSALHSVPLYMNQVNSAILRIVAGNDALSITTSMHPLPRTRYQNNFDSGVDSFNVTFYILIAFSFVPAAWMAYIVREKETKCKHQQVVSGVGLEAYWLSSYLWDFVSLMPPMAFTLIILAAADVGTLISGEAGATTFLLFLLYGTSMPCYTYLWSFAFKNYSTAQNAFLFHNWITGLILPIATSIMAFFDGKVSDVGDGIATLARLVPQYALGSGLMKMSFIPILSFFNDTEYTPLDGAIAGNSLRYMGVCSVVYFVLLLVFERISAGGSFLSGIYGKLVLGRSLKKLTPKQLGDEDNIDEDVRAEMDRVATGAADNDVVKVAGLRKVYPVSNGAKVAVKSTSLGIPRGECFGLLGINGAGKSSTLAILSGELPPTTGSALLGGFDVGKNPEEIHRLVGYCPQFDALFETLTGREHLALYAAIKGIPADKRSAAVNQKIEEMGLTRYAERPAGGYSGGNKRKLSVAMAMIGDPQVGNKNRETSEAKDDGSSTVVAELRELPRLSIVFLDEPSTGMDPMARRFMWNVIMRIVTENKECAMILTTHSMEECEALCQRIGIMVGGRLRCLGTSQHLKTRFGKGFQLEARVKAILPEETDAMMTELASATNGQGTLGNDGGVLRAALAAAQAPELEAEVSPTGRGASIYHAIANQGGVPVRDLAAWICVEKKCSKVIAFMQQQFAGAVMREKQNAKMRFEFPPQKNQTLAQMFGVVEVFNGFAAQQEEELGHAAGTMYLRVSREGRERSR